MAPLPIRRGSELRYVHVARIELGRQAPDGPALARRIPTLEQDQNGRTEFAVADQPSGLEPQSKQPLLCVLESFEPDVLRELQ